MKDKKLRLEDAINATRAAVEEGIVPGGGTRYNWQQGFGVVEYDEERFRIDTVGIYDGHSIYNGKEYIGKKLGSYLLSEAIKKSFEFGSKRVWVHTCSLDHKNALKNYLSRGMAIFKSEILNTKIA